MNSSQNVLSRSMVVLLNFGSGTGSEQSNTRPAIIVSNNICNKYSPVITVIPLTTKVYRKEMPTHVLLKSNGKYAIHNDSVALAEQIRTVSTDRICSDMLFKLDAEDMGKIDKAIRVQMGLQY